MKKIFYIFLICLSFLFITDVKAQEQMICEYTSNANYSYTSLTKLVREPKKNIVDAYSNALELFKKNVGAKEYVVTLQLTKPVTYEEENHAWIDEFAFYFRYDNLYTSYSNASGDSFTLWSTNVWKYVFSYKSSTDSYDYNSSASSKLTDVGAYDFNRDSFINISGLDYCSTNPLIFFTGNVELKLPDSYTNYEIFYPIYNNSNYKYISLGGTSSIPYITDNYLTDISSMDYKELSLDVSDYLVIYPTIYDDDVATKPFKAKIFAKGEFCLTPVYNYGTEEKANPSTNGCYSYDDYTAIDISLSKEDLANHVVFYISNYNGKTESYIKIKPSVFNYRYFYYDDEPTLDINGNTYNLISYDKLKTTAKSNTEDGIIPGASCTLGDLDCTADNDPNYSGFSNIINNILDFGLGIWGSVVNFMSLVTKFISCLPSEFQTVILTCFTTACIIAVVKIFIK